jgi:hypothetical protein
MFHTREKAGNAYTIFVAKPVDEEATGIYRRRWEENNKMNLKER